MNVVNFRCPKCGELMNAPKDWIGKAKYCPQCNNAATVPASTWTPIRMAICTAAIVIVVAAVGITMATYSNQAAEEAEKNLKEAQRKHVEEIRGLTDDHVSQLKRAAETRNKKENELKIQLGQLKKQLSMVTGELRGSARDNEKLKKTLARQIKEAKQLTSRFAEEKSIIKETQDNTAEWAQKIEELEGTIKRLRIFETKVGKLNASVRRLKSAFDRQKTENVKLTAEVNRLKTRRRTIRTGFSR